MTTDVRMVCVDDGYFDLVIDGNGDFLNGDFFDSSIEYAILGERRASESEVPQSSLRRGWIGNEEKDFENGSKIWLFEQERITRTVLNGLKDAALDSLNYLITDELVQDITAEITVVSRIVILTLTIQRFQSKVEKRYFTLWENTGVQNAA